MPYHSYVAKLAILLSVIDGIWAKTVTTTNGTVQGRICDTSDVEAFLGLPYALPPVGALRFAAPESYNKKYDGVLDATAQPPSCPQFGLDYVEDGKQSEDCLYLDIWVPATAHKNSNLPVKIWFYGGSNEGGSVSDPLYDGCNSAVDSIVVSVNFRLGPLGFLAYPDAGITGNYGIQDQLLALKWVQGEIGSFGGNPDMVLLFGQSAGAMDSYLLSSLPQAPSLFRAVALESGGGRDSPSVADTKAVYAEYIRSLNCNLDNALACLRNASLTALNTTTISLDTSSGNILGAESFLEGNGSGNAWLAVVDGDIVPDNPASVGVRVPAIIGSNANDGSLDVLSQYTTNVLNITQTDYYEFLENSFGPLATTVNETYPWSAFVAVSPVPGFTAMTTVITDYAYKCPAYRALQKAAANGIEAWAYNFNHTPSCPWYSGIPNSALDLLGATHTSEIPFVFGWTSGLPRPNGSCNLTDQEVAISDFMLGAWTSMAASGRPANSSVWPAWTANGTKGIVISNSVTARSLDYSECEFWDKIQAGVLKLDTSMAANATSSSTSGNVTTSQPTPVSHSNDLRVPSAIVFGLSLSLAICVT